MMRWHHQENTILVHIKPIRDADVNSASLLYAIIRYTYFDGDAELVMLVAETTKTMMDNRILPEDDHYTIRVMHIYKQEHRCYFLTIFVQQHYHAPRIKSTKVRQSITHVWQPCQCSMALNHLHA